MSEEKETRSKSDKSGMSKKSKKSKKSSKSKKVKKVVETEPEPELVDINVPESDDEEAVVAYVVQPTESKKGFASYFTFTKAETPLLCYTIGALIFFFASVGKKCPSFATGIPGFGGRRHLQFTDDTPTSTGDLDNLFGDLDNLFEDLDNFWGSSGDDFFGGTLDNAFGNVLGGLGLGCLSTGYYAYAICFSIFGVLFGAGVLGWMKYNASLAENRKGLAGYDEQDIEDGMAGEETNKSVSELFLDNHKKWIDLFLFVWATAGWAVFTFSGNGLFSITGNGKGSPSMASYCFLSRLKH